MCHYSAEWNTNLVFFRCVKEFNQINEYSFFTFFSWNLLALSSLLVAFQFQLVEYTCGFKLCSIYLAHVNILFFSFSQWADDSNLLETICLFFTLIWITIFTVLICEPGAKMTNQFVAFSNELSICDWYSLPIEVQRMYVISLSDTQNPIKMSSYANITCERDTSKKVSFCRT